MITQLFGMLPPSAPAMNSPAPAGRANAPHQQFAPLNEFAAWLVNAGETHSITKDRLQTLYGEFCEYTDSEPLTQGQLFRRLRAAGIERYRETIGRRRWFYRVRTATVFELQRSASVA